MDQDQTLTIEETQIESLSVSSNVELPILIIIVALLKDISDIVSTGIAGIITSLVFGMIIYLWIFSKSTIIQRRMMKWFIRRFVVVIIIGIIPLINFVPEATILVLLVYNREKGIVKDFFDSLEGVYRIG